jgi:hypothetical protein
MKIHLPWLSGLGCLGLSTKSAYRDLTILRDGRIQLFVGDRKDDRGLTQRSSWYILQRVGLRLRWTLIKRQDEFGLWRKKTGIHEPMLWYVTDAYATRDWHVHQLGRRLKPYSRIDWYGEELEIISRPFPDVDSVRVLMRRPNDPTTMKEYTLLEYAEGPR